jgi:DNA replication protein DnaC
MTDTPELPLADRIAKTQRRWPWQSVPPSYRMPGKPTPAVLAAAKASIGYDDDRDRLPILTLIGSVGVGKTTEACRLASYLAAGWGDRHIEAVTYRLALRMGWIDREEVDELVAEKVTLLILDDLSAGLTAAGLTHALEIIEGRIAWHRRTIITTSLTLEQITALEVKHHGREIGVGSRIAGGEVLTMAGDDRRMA